MSIYDELCEAGQNISKKCLPYYGEGSGGIGCSTFAKRCFYAIGKITQAELDNDYSMWAGQGIPGFLNDTSRFEKIPWSAKSLKKGDILYSNYHHVAIWDGNKGVYEAAPLRHGVCDNGKTGVGHFSNHSYYNCGTGTNTWDCIYRMIDGKATDKIELAIAEAERIAADDSIGYCNEYPYNTGIKGYDCGGFISRAWQVAGVFPCGQYYEPLGSGSNYNLYNEKLLTDNGFTKNRYNNYSVLKRGDILVSGGHTVMYLGNYKIIHARNNYDGKEGDSSGREIATTDYYEGNWCYYFRYGSGIDGSENYDVLSYGSSGSLVKTLQSLLNAKLNIGLAVDGSFGPATLQAVKEYQKNHNLEIDGYVGPKTWASLLSEDIAAPEVTAKEKLEAALAVLNGTYGNNPERAEKLASKYGSRVADQIQQIVDKACEE